MATGALTLASRTAGRRRRARGWRSEDRAPFQAPTNAAPNATVAHSPTLTATATRVEAASMVATQVNQSVRVASVGLIICPSLSNRQHHRPELSNHNGTKKWAKKSQWTMAKS